MPAVSVNCATTGWQPQYNNEDRMFIAEYPVVIVHESVGR
jgi:hypothetical protein